MATVKGFGDDIQKELRLRELLRQLQWDEAIQLINSGVSTESRDAALGLAARCGQWERITQILQQDGGDVFWDSLLCQVLQLRHGDCITHIKQRAVSEECLKAVLHEAFKHGQWEAVAQVVKKGVHVAAREVILHEAVRHNQLDCMIEILRQGVSLLCRDSALTEAIQQRQWQCVALLVRHGVSCEQIQLAMRQLLADNHIDHILETGGSGTLLTLTDHQLRQLVNQCKWDCITQLVRLGILSAEQREYLCQEAVPWGHHECAVELLGQGLSEASLKWIVLELFRWNKWHLLIDLIKQRSRTCFCWPLEILRRFAGGGCSLECREVFILEALRQQQWECVTQIMQQGVSLHCRDSAFKEAVQHNRWQCVAVLVKHGVSSEQIQVVVKQLLTENHLDYTLEMYSTGDLKNTTENDIRSLVNQCKWDCLKKLVSLGLLSSSQREYVSREAVSLGHLECAVELLRQGIGCRNTERILSEVFRRGRWQLITVLMRQGLPLSPDKRTLYFSTAVALGQWEAFLQILLFQPASDSDLRKAMAAAVSSSKQGILQQIIRNTKSGFRVFKQMCLKQIWLPTDAFQLFVNLRAREKALAFHVAATQGLTNIILDLYEDTSVSKKSRRFALRHAIRQGDWDLVIHMASRPVTEASQRRLAFLAAIRQGKWRVALKLLDCGLTLSNKDVKFSLRICRSLNQLDGVVQLCLRFGSYIVGTAAMKTAVFRTAETGDLDSFGTLLHRCVDLFLNDKIFKALVRKLVKIEKPGFLVKLMENFDDIEPCEEEMTVAIETISMFRKWEFLRGVLDSNIYLCINHYLLILEKIMNRRKARRICMPALEKRCMDLDWDDLGMMCYLNDLPNAPALAKWCHRQSFHNMSVFLAVRSKNWPLVTKTVRGCGGRVGQGLLITGMICALDDGKIDAAVVFLRHLDPKTDHLPLHLSGDDVYRDLREKCRQAGLHGWMIGAAIRNDKWDDVEADLEQCTDQSLIDFATTKAAYRDRWTSVEKFLDRCSQENGFLGRIFRLSLEEGNLPCAGRLIVKVDIPNLDFSTRIMEKAVGSRNNRIEVVRLCIEAGVSCHSVLGDICSPMRRALYNGQLPIVRLLYESGCSCNSHLHSLKKDQTLRAQLQRQRRQDIVQYLDHVASNPASLQQLCRLTVSRLVGCCPGRWERVRSLPLPVFVHDFIMFSELTSDPEQG